MVRAMQGRGRDENKKIEGTAFGFPKNAILDYPLLYLEKIFVRIYNFRKSSKIKKSIKVTFSWL
jgi:hypothetical protein